MAMARKIPAIKQNTVQCYIDYSKITLMAQDEITYSDSTDLFTKDEDEFHKSPSTFVFSFSYCSPTSFLTQIISLSAAYLAQVYVQMDLLLKKHSLK